MKRFIISAILLLSLAISTSAFAVAGSCTQTVTKIGAQALLTFVCTAGSTDHLYPVTAVSAANMAKLNGYWVDEIMTIPGGTAPTDGTAITLTQSPTGQDIFNARAVVSATIGKSFAPIKDPLGSLYGGKTVTGTLTLTPTGNSVNSAVFTAVVTLWNN